MTRIAKIQEEIRDLSETNYRQLKLISILVIFSLILVCSSICPIWAKAPETPKVVFASFRDGNRDIYLMDPDGTQQVKITSHRATDTSAVWSPSGEQILFASDRDQGQLHWDLYLMDADGKNGRKVFEKSADRSQATWGPNGEKIAYKRREPNGPFIYIGTIDGKKEERVAIGSGPAWSPDGTEIAFVSGAKERKQISILNVHTRKAKPLFPPKAIPSWIEASVAWSPKGDKLAFSWVHQVPLKDFDNTQTIYIVNRDGTGLVQIVDEVGPKATSPTWSPEGDALLYTQHRQIFKIAVDERQPEQLTHTGVNHLGDWFDPIYALPVSPQPHLSTTVWGQLKTE